MFTTIRAAILASLLSCVAVAADKDVISGRVTKVIDGDTIVVDSRGEKVTVRLEGIDAPERGQDFGTAATKHLRSMVDEKDLIVIQTGTDKYGRKLGTIVTAEGSVNAKMVSDGYAWHFKKYSTDKDLAEREVEARNARRGLWAMKNPVPPWDYRKDKAASSKK